MTKKHSVMRILEDTVKHRKDIQDIVIVARGKNEVITEAYSYMNKTEVLGLLECAKHSVLLDMTEEE